MSPDLQYEKGETPETESQVPVLARLAKAGNKEPFEKLVDIFQKEIFRMVYYRTQSYMDAEDLTQEVFIKAYESLHTLREVHYFKSWLFKIAINRVRDFKRKKQIFVFLGTEKREERRGI